MANVSIMILVSSNQLLSRRTAPVVAACFLLASLTGAARAQQGYGSFYGQQAVQSHGSAAQENPTNYLYNKYFNNRPSVSPYINLGRADTLDGTAYQTYVRPEQERRERTMQAQNAYLDARKREGRVGDTRFPGATYGGGGTAIMKPAQKRPNTTPSHYHNHWFGSWGK
jgi:hypothetical protein